MYQKKIFGISVIALLFFAGLFAFFNTFYVTNAFTFDLLEHRSVVQFTLRQFDVDTAFVVHHVVKVDSLSFFQGLSNIMYFLMQLAFVLLFLGIIYFVVLVVLVGLYDYLHKRTGNEFAFYTLIFIGLFAAIYTYGFWHVLNHGLYYPFLFMVALIFSPLFLLLEFILLLFQSGGISYYLLWLGVFALPFFILYVIENGFDFSRSSGGVSTSYVGKNYAELSSAERRELADSVDQSMINMYGTSVYRPHQGSDFMTAPDGTMFTREQWEREITRVRRDHGVRE